MNTKNENEMINENEVINQTQLENEVVENEKPVGDAEPIIEIESAGDAEPIIEIESAGDAEPIIEIEFAGDAEPIIEIEPDENFEPLNIGVPDFKKTNQVVSIYERFIKQLAPLQKEIESCLEMETPFSTDEFIEYLQEKNPKLWLLNRYISEKKIDFGQMDPLKMDPLKMMELGIIPSPNIATAIELTKKIQSTIEDIAREKFNFPIRMLFDQELKDWDLTSDFYDKLQDFATRKTQTAKQNLIVKKFERICEVLNELAELDVLRPKNGPTELDFLDDFITINKFFKTNPMKKELGETVLEAFTVDPYVFHKHRLQPFRVKGLAGIQKSEFAEAIKLFS